MTPEHRGSSRVYRFNARNAFLTYSNLEQQSITDATAWRFDLVAFLIDQFKPEYILHCLERHIDGNNHVHCLVKFGRKLDIDGRRFYFGGVKCNVQAAKKIPAVIHYIKKDGEWDEYGSCNEPESIPTSSINFFEIARNTDYEGWINECIMLKLPYGYSEAIWNHISKKSVNTIDEDTPINGTMIPSLRTYVLPSNYKSIILLGPAGCGKTTYAKTVCEKPALFVTHLDVLKEFNPTIHKSIIFDDMDFRYLPRCTQIHLVDTENPRAIHRRYGITTIPAGISKYFTCNEYPFIDDEAIKRRTKLINIRLL